MRNRRTSIEIPNGMQAHISLIPNPTETRAEIEDIAIGTLVSWSADATTLYGEVTDIVDPNVIVAVYTLTDGEWVANGENATVTIADVTVIEDFPVETPAEPPVEEQSVAARIVQLIKRSLQNLKWTDKQQHAINADQMIDQFIMLISDAPEFQDGWYPMLMDFFWDESGEQYGIVAWEGRLFRVNFSVTNGAVVLGAIEQVEVQHVPVSQSISMTRGTDGVLRFAAIASAAVLTRSGRFIDSTALFDSFEENFTEPIPLRYHHIDGLDFGTIEGVARVNHLLVEWGTIDETHPIGAQAESAFTDGTYELSIGFDAEPPTMTEMGGINVLVFTSGKLVETSVLADGKAESHMTGILTSRKGLIHMGQTKAEIKQDLQAFGLEDDEIDNLLEGLDVREAAIASKKMITRRRKQTRVDAEPEPEMDDDDIEPDDVESIADEPESDEPDDTTFTLDEDAIAEMSAQVVAELGASILEQVNLAISEALSGLQETLDTLNTTLQTSQATVNQMLQADDERLRNIKLDAPGAIRTRNTVPKATFRPSQDAPDDDTPETMPSIAERAEQTAALLNQ